MIDIYPVQQPNTNFCIGNRFFIFGDIDDTIPERIIAPMFSHIDQERKKRDPDPIEIFISSSGGSVHHCLDIVSHIELAKRSGITVYTSVTSHAYSAAAIIAICGSHRMASEYATYMFHHARIEEFSHNPEMAKRNLDNRSFIDKTLVEIIKRYTRITDVEKILNDDNYFVNGGKNLKRMGIIDAVF